MGAFEGFARVEILKAALSTLLHELLFIRLRTKHTNQTPNQQWFPNEVHKVWKKKITAIKSPKCSSLKSTLLVDVLKWTLPQVLPPARKAGHWDDVRTESLPPSCRWPRQTSPFGSYYRFCPPVPPCSYTWTCAVLRLQRIKWHVNQPALSRHHKDTFSNPSLLNMPYRTAPWKLKGDDKHKSTVETTTRVSALTDGTPNQLPTRAYSQPTRWDPSMSHALQAAFTLNLRSRWRPTVLYSGSFPTWFAQQGRPRDIQACCKVPLCRCQIARWHDKLLQREADCSDLVSCSAGRKCSPTVTTAGPQEVSLKASAFSMRGRFSASPALHYCIFFILFFFKNNGFIRGSYIKAIKNVHYFYISKWIGIRH